MGLLIIIFLYPTGFSAIGGDNTDALKNQSTSLFRIALSKDANQILCQVNLNENGNFRFVRYKK